MESRQVIAARKKQKIESSQHGNVEYPMLAMKFKELKLFRLDFC